MEYDSVNRLIKYNGKTVEYDKDGNMTYGPLDGEMAHFTYDCRNRLIAVKADSGAVTEYRYDAENNRIGMTRNAGTKEEERISYVVDTASGDLSQVLVKETEDTVTYYTYGNGLVAQETYTKDNEHKKNDALISNVSEYLVYHYNNVGSTVAVTDEKGAITHTYSYTPYGELVNGKYGEVDYLYNGQYGVTSDANGLYYMRARYYNIDIKRFINQDILTGSIDSSKSLNRYAYVEGNPISYLDPLGLDKNDIISKVVEIKNKACYFITGGGTISVGGTLSGGAFGAGGGSFGIAIDSKGNIHFQSAGAMGYSMPNLGVGFYFSCLNAPDLNEIGSTGEQRGGSLDVGFSWGLDYITARNKHGDDFKGTSINIGLGVSTLPGEAHYFRTKTLTDLKLTKD